MSASSVAQASARAHVLSDPLALTPARLRAFVRDVAKPDGIDGCWEWRGATNSSGYGTTTSSRVAHRVAFEWLVGPIPNGLELDHLCRNPRCVNPHHLEPVTPRENRRRVCVLGPWRPRRYCRRGHSLDGGNGRLWSDGRRGRLQVRCYRCHDKREAIRHGA